MKVAQTKKAKEEFYSPAYQLIKTTKTRADLSRILGLSDRKVRDEINGISKHYAVIRGSFQKGYRLAKGIKTMTLEEMEAEANLVQRTIDEFNAKITDMKKPQKPLIAYKKILEKEMFKLKQKK